MSGSNGPKKRDCRHGIRPQSQPQKNNQPPSHGGTHTGRKERCAARLHLRTDRPGSSSGGWLEKTSVRPLPARYALRSTNTRRGAGCCQFRPDFRPVIGAQVLAGDGAGRHALDRHTALDGDRASTRAPLADSWPGHAEQSGHLSDAADDFACAFDFVHSRMIRHCQATVKALPQFSRFVKVGYA